jgi:hypothetical protein
MIGPMISASGTPQILVATKPVDFRNYAERVVMRSPRRDVAAHRGFFAGLTPHNSVGARPCSAWP